MATECFVYCHTQPNISKRWLKLKMLACLIAALTIILFFTLFNHELSVDDEFQHDKTWRFEIQ